MRKINNGLFCLFVCFFLISNIDLTLIAKYNIITFIMSGMHVPRGNNQRITGGIHNDIRRYQLCTLHSTSSCLFRQLKSHGK